MMKIYIQSKSGNYNTVAEVTSQTAPPVRDLIDAMAELRRRGGYGCWTNRKEFVQVPFEEIEYIRAATEEELGDRPSK